ncbi:probable F-box protein At5g04010 [Chenopodium quinoa]|uniref:F-box protein n=1 Tax=Chenopodium quinoa TaxID=63459 RepID=A0A803MJE7_CHEQI|nr:probable F-box protein At5g04010 [Chenopodium quinoa]
MQINDDDDKVMLLSSPPWEILNLVSHYLDPNTLAIATCVSKTWSTCFSSDHLWDPLCTATFPTLATTLGSVAASLPRHRLYALGHTAALCRQWKPRKPRLSLDHLLFVIAVHLPGGSLNMIKPCIDMRRDPHGLFRFDVEVVEERELSLEELKEAKVTWTVAEKEWKAVFVLAEESVGKLASGVDGFFSKELPSPGCCSNTMSSGLVADIRFGLKDSQDSSRRSSGDRMSRIEKVSVGVMSVLNWRHVSVEDVLFYLEHFLQV